MVDNIIFCLSFQTAPSRFDYFIQWNIQNFLKKIKAEILSGCFRMLQLNHVFQKSTLSKIWRRKSKEQNGCLFVFFLYGFIFIAINNQRIIVYVIKLFIYFKAQNSTMCFVNLYELFVNKMYIQACFATLTITSKCPFQIISLNPKTILVLSS